MATETQVAPHGATPGPMHGKADHKPTSTSSQTHIYCPDPSAHQTKDTSLQDQASAAALHSTRPAKDNAGRNGNVLGPDGKLSSASAATSLKHARAQDLPGFPVVGIDTQSSAGTAATLANANKKSPEWWKPGQSEAAGKAALLAKDYKMSPLWQPEASSAGSKAALLAHRGGPNLNLWTPEASAEGHSAATLAMKRQSTNPVVDPSAVNEQQERSSWGLRAATGAVSSSGRQRAQSTPIAPPLYPDSANSAKNALNAAKLAHTPSMKVSKPPTRPPTTSDSNRLGSGAMEAARIQHAKSISRDMYTERPPLAMGEEEKQRQAALRASAVSMAKKMYDVQQDRTGSAGNRLSPAQTGAAAAQSGSPAPGSDADIKEQAMRYIGIQEAAQKLAAERLAKIGPDENAAFRSYYGYDKPARSKLSIRRRRNSDRAATTDPEVSDSDEDDFRSRRIRSQMNQLNKSLAEVDAKKRENDRKYLLAAAERKVQAQLQGMDKDIFDKTGKMSPAMIEDWDAKARARATAASEARMENHGKVHIGHGKFVDQADIDAVAQARIQPTLDEIAEKTEKRRAEEEEKRLDLEQKKREQQKEKVRAAELKAEEKRIKDDEKRALKSRNAEAKAAAKQEKEGEKERKAEEKRMQKDGRKATETAPTATAVVASGGAGTAAGTDATEETSPVTATHIPEPTEDHANDDLYRDVTPAAAQRTEPDSTSPTSPTSPKSDSKGLKSFLNKLKRRSKHSAATAETDKAGFIGGANLRRSSSPPAHNSTPTSPQPQAPRTPERRYSDVSSISSVEDANPNPRGRQRTASGFSGVSATSEYSEARDEFDERLAPPPSFPSFDAAAGRKGSPNRDSKFHEIGI